MKCIFCGKDSVEIINDCNEWGKNTSMMMECDSCDAHGSRFYYIGEDEEKIMREKAKEQWKHMVSLINPLFRKGS